MSSHLSFLGHRGARLVAMVTLTAAAVLTVIHLNDVASSLPGFWPHQTGPTHRHLPPQIASRL